MIVGPSCCLRVGPRPSQLVRDALTSNTFMRVMKLIRYIYFSGCSAAPILLHKRSLSIAFLRPTELTKKRIQSGGRMLRIGCKGFCRATTVMTTMACQAQRWSGIRTGSPSEVKAVRNRRRIFDIASASSNFFGSVA